MEPKQAAVDSANHGIMLCEFEVCMLSAQYRSALHLLVSPLRLCFSTMPADAVCACGCSLSKKKTAEKKVAITVFSFPPDKGNVGTAAYLNVFGSIYRVLQDLKAQGYTVDGVPEKEEDLIKSVGTQW